MYDEIFYAVGHWLWKVSKEYADQLSLEVEKAEQNTLEATLETRRYTAHLSVSEPDFRPYRYVEFVITEPGAPTIQEPEFLYHDSENDSPEDVLEGLDEGLDFLLTRSYC